MFIVAILFILILRNAISVIIVVLRTAINFAFLIYHRGVSYIVLRRCREMIRASYLQKMSPTRVPGLGGCAYVSF
jgi:hypothetical protein